MAEIGDKISGGVVQATLKLTGTATPEFIDRLVFDGLPPGWEPHMLYPDGTAELFGRGQLGARCLDWENVEIVFLAPDVPGWQERQTDQGPSADRNRVMRACQYCGKPVKEARRKFCSRLCDIESRRKFRVTDADLARLVWEMPLGELAKRHGVTATAIASQCRKRNITTPPDGYWLTTRKKRKLEMEGGQMPLVPCACGCGVLIPKWAAKGGRRYCVLGHNPGGNARFSKDVSAKKLGVLMEQLKELGL